MLMLMPMLIELLPADSFNLGQVCNSFPLTPGYRHVSIVNVPLNHAT